MRTRPLRIAGPKLFVARDYCDLDAKGAGLPSFPLGDKRSPCVVLLAADGVKRGGRSDALASKGERIDEMFFEPP